MKKIKFPIFLKLLILFIVFILIVNLSAGFIAKLTLGIDPAIIINNYVLSLNDYILRDIGYPPDIRKAQEIAFQKNLDIRYETTDFVWSNSDRIPPLKELRSDPDFREGAPQFPMRYRGSPLFITKLRNGYVIISPVRPMDLMDRDKAILLIIAVISVLTLALYFSLRWIFGPIKTISKDIDEISRGNLNTRIVLNRSDELGKLADSINAMKEKISSMINSKESLLVDVSHELRSPLTRIKLACEFVEDEILKKKINEDVNELETMIKELLDTYKNENSYVYLNKEKIDLKELLVNIISKFSSGRIKLQSDNKEYYVNADKKGIETVFKNIIDNALKYSEDKNVYVTLSEISDKVKVSVKDEGKGVSKDEIEKIFEPFYRIDKSRNKKIQGYGLGLSLVKKILDGHELEYEIISNPESGTEFIIIFPAA
ncbi:MAG: HAMP domain-containing histidine kinase [Bacteroidetes bacterium]|nr:HAMP domain-containing histidine kinase [Bacteroidota bacterium]